VSNDVCDHTSVGIVVWRDGKLLIVERKKFPYGFAPPAGHRDGDRTGVIAAARELTEETGLHAPSLTQIYAVQKANPCRRQGGTHHNWEIFEEQSPQGRLRLSTDETVGGSFVDKKRFMVLMEATRKFRIGRITEDEWQKRGGMELVWFEMFLELQAARLLRF
jgi:ADP-ribose pyrophosphatase YjhB (NUDIX family)